VHSHVLEESFHAKTSSPKHPPSIRSPDEVISKPEGEDLDNVVSSPASLTLIESSKSSIPFPAPIFKVSDPGPVPVDERPLPAVTDVMTYDPALIESKSSPCLPTRRLSSDALKSGSIP